MSDTDRAPPPYPIVIEEETLSCCGFKRCPVIRTFEDGHIELVDDDTESGSVGTIKMNTTQARALAKWIVEHT